jgi:hypothetical protein
VKQLELSNDSTAAYVNLVSDAANKVKAENIWQE